MPYHFVWCHFVSKILNNKQIQQLEWQEKDQTIIVFLCQ